MELPLRSAKRPEGGGAVLFEPDGIRRAGGEARPLLDLQGLIGPIRKPGPR